MPVVEDLEQIPILFACDDRHAEVIDHDESRSRQLLEQLHEAAVGLGILQSPKQFGCVVVANAVAIAASLVRQGASQASIERAGLPGNEAVDLL